MSSAWRQRPRLQSHVEARADEDHSIGPVLTRAVGHADLLTGAVADVWIAYERRARASLAETARAYKHVPSIEPSAWDQRTSTALLAAGAPWARSARLPALSGFCLRLACDCFLAARGSRSARVTWRGCSERDADAQGWVRRCRAQWCYVPCERNAGACARQPSRRWAPRPDAPPATARPHRAR